MDTLQSAFTKREYSRGNGDGKEVYREQAASSVLPLTTTPPELSVQDQRKEIVMLQDIASQCGEPRKGRDGKGPEALPTLTNAGLPSPPIKQKPIRDPTPDPKEGDDHDKTASTSSIWTSAATTLKNLVIGKAQALTKDIVTVVPDPKTTREAAPSLTSRSTADRLEKGKGKATSYEAGGLSPTDENVLPVLDPTDRPPQSYDPKSKAERRPSAPPSRLSSIAYSLPTTSSHPPPTSQQSTTSASSSQSPNSITSNQTATSTTTVTDEENQAAALLALNAVIHSVGTGYTQPLTSRAAQLHANDQMLAQQREKLLHSSALLAKDTEALRKLAVESNNKLKGFGDLKNWSDTLDSDLNAIEETLKLVERGEVETCARCGGPIDEDEEQDEQRWCGECGKGFHLLCAGQDPEVVEGKERYGPGLGDDEYDDVRDDANQDPANVKLPSSLPSTSTAQQPSRDMAVMSSLFSTFSSAATAPQASVPSVPKPSSMFEWGGIPDNLRLEDEEGSESGSGSEWSSEDWMCQECRLKDDLDAIGRGL